MNKINLKHCLIIIIGIFAISCLNFEKSVKKGDYKKHINWKGKDYEEFYKNGWVTLPLYRIKSAVNIKDQGDFGSCLPNSCGRAFELAGIPFQNEYEDFLAGAKLYATSNIKRKQELDKKRNNGSNIFDQIVKLQNEYYKNNHKVKNHLLKQSFEDGSNYTNISKYINKTYSNKLIVDYNIHYSFGNCVKYLIENISNKNPVIGSFNGTNYSSHAMNIIGYYKQYSKIESFGILNTWGGNKTFGEISYHNCQKCMNKPNYYTLKFRKKY